QVIALRARQRAEGRLWAALALVKKGENLAIEGKAKEAITNYQQAQKFDSKLKISADSWKTLCWYGSLHGYAAKVMDACEKAVTLEPDSGMILDSRGVARALTGNTAGAIEDFQAFINWTDSDSDKEQRQGWIDALKAGKDPFTKAEIDSLLER
ncbi:MAG: hypothetical protein F6J89_28855, partial [Symploca sp. SIO1C4]|nr:hypothetical protein [Symploca sp. SIO1C4]